MRIIRAVAGLLIVVLVIGAGVYVVVHKGSRNGAAPPPEPTEFIPDFSFPDRQGQEVTFTNVDARIRIVNFWASWSPYSRDELPALVRIKQDYGDDIEVVALNRDTNPNDGRAFFDSLKLGDSLIELYDQQDTYYKTVRGYNMPETLFVNPEGGVLAQVHGPMTYEQMKSTLDTLLQY